MVRSLNKLKGGAKMLRKVLFLTLAVSLLLSTYSLTYADTIKLKVTAWAGATNRMSKLIDNWCQELNKKLAGEVEVTFYPGGILLAPPKIAAGVAHGLADIGMSNLAYTRGLFPVMETMDLPLGFPSGWIGAHVANDFYQRVGKLKEFERYHVLGFTACPPNVIMTMKPVRTLEDMKGMKIRGIGRFGDIVKALGGTPVPVEIGDLYDSLNRGVIEGALLPLEVMKSVNVGEILKYVTSASKLGNIVTFYMIMNKKKWDSLPPHVQKVITESNKDFFEEFPVVWNNLAIEGLDFFKQNGGQVVTVSEAESTRWIKAVDPVIASHKEELVSKGFKAADVDGWLNYIKERMDYWTIQQKSKNIPSAL